MTQNTKAKNIWHLSLFTATIIVINLLSTNWFFRLDLTSEKRYTLSENTRELFNDLSETFFIKVYLDGDLNIGFKKLSKASQELLDELRIYGGKHVQYRFIDPNQGSKKEKEATLNELSKLGLSPQQVFEKTADGRNTQSLVYPYAVIHYNGLQLPVSLLENIQGFSGAENLNKSIESLEFKFTDAVRRLITKEKPKIAFIEGHGELDELDVLDITDQLSQYYQVERGILGSNPDILNPYKAVIIAKPQSKFSESDKFILDQYLMKGGRIMWLVDAVNITLDSLRKAGETIGLMSDLNIEDQLFKYGIRINPVLLQDIQAAMIPVSMATQNQKPRIVPAPWLYNPLLIPQPNHSISRNMNVVQGEFVSYIDTVNTQLNLKRTVLLRTSRYTKADQIPVFVSLAFVNEKPDRRTFNKSFLPVSILQEGSFPSVFQNRLIPKNIQLGSDSIRSWSTTTKMIVVADGDMIKNKVRFKDTNPQVLPLGHDELTKQTFGNKEFLINAINYLCDDEGWMDLRARTYTLRLLDKNKIANESTKWKLINLLLPILLLVLLGIGNILYRKSTFTK
jgi:ABC-2 type transport system permease protein